MVHHIVHPMGIPQQQKQPYQKTSTTNSYKYLSVSGVAPTNANGVQAMVIFRTGTDTNHSLTNGSAIVDDLSLRIFEPEYSKVTTLWLR